MQTEDRVKIRRILFVILAVIWMGVIFWFSARTGSESQQQSNHLGFLIGQWVIPGFDGWSQEAQQLFVEYVDVFVRKGGHASEFAVLGMLLVGASDWRQRGIRIFGSSLSLAACYGASDEIHQLFVPGRAGLIRDVMIDSAGAAVGILTAMAAGYLLIRIRRR